MAEEIKKYATYLHDKKTNENYPIRDAEAVHQDELHAVARSGSYNDLIDKPVLSIPTLPAELEEGDRYTLSIKVVDGTPVLYWAKLQAMDIPNPEHPSETVRKFVIMDDEGNPLTFGAVDSEGQPIAKIVYVED